MIHLPANSKRIAREWSPRGIEGRIYHIRDLIKKSIMDTEISRGLALRLTAACPRRDGICEIESIWHFMHGIAPDGLPNVRYTGDIDGYDTFQSARATLQFRAGDCDDAAILIPALVMGNGFPAKCRITANPDDPQNWAHIYPLALNVKQRSPQWWPLDWTLGYQFFGTHPPQAKWVEFDGSLIRYSPAVIAPHEYRGW